MSEEPKNLGGRPTSYKPEFAEQAYKLCLLGATDQDLANFFEVCEKTINTWKKEYTKFIQSLKKGKAESDLEVVKSLRSRAVGYSCPDTKFATFEGKITDQKEYIKHYPPDPVSGIFWLKNRNPEKWRDKIDVAHSGDINIKIDKDDEKT